MKAGYTPRKLLAVLLTSLLFSCSENIDKPLNISRVATQELGVQLKDTLKSSIKSNGPVDAITACNVEAEKIANTVSNSNDVKVGRTSLKVRNSSNTPDSWEREKLIYLEQKILSGVNAKGLEVYEVTKENNEKWFRYMKAIPTTEVCLLCHGQS